VCALQVSEKYSEAERAFLVDELLDYVPQAWVSMVQIKQHHYQALAHYYAGLGSIEQHGKLYVLIYVCRSAKFHAKFINFFARLCILFYRSPMYETFRTESRIK